MLSWVRMFRSRQWTEDIHFFEQNMKTFKTTTVCFDLDAEGKGPLLLQAWHCRKSWGAKVEVPYSYLESWERSASIDGSRNPELFCEWWMRFETSWSSLYSQALLSFAIVPPIESFLIVQVFLRPCTLNVQHVICATLSRHALLYSNDDANPSWGRLKQNPIMSHCFVLSLVCWRPSPGSSPPLS